MKSYFIFLLFFYGASFGASSRAEYYCETYESCRANFAERVNAYVAGLPADQKALAEVGRWYVPSRVDSDLTIDSLFLPATRQPRNLLILSSGVHGVEGFAGSAVQALFLKEILPKLDRASTGVFLVHAVNPYGMKYLRRVSENNVDLNRNFDIDSHLFNVKNDGYRKLAPILNPESPATQGFLSSLNFYYHVGRLLLREPLRTLRQAVLQGQYEFPQGLYFGGREFEPQKGLLEKALLDRSKPYENVLALDLHTGYGSNGVLHLFTSPYESPKVEAATKAIFAGYSLDAGDSKDFYTNYGDFAVFVTKLLQRSEKLVVPMTLEYGTFDNQSYYGSIESLRRMIAENRHHWHGADGDATAAKIRRQFLDLYFPKSRRWREKILQVTAERLPVIVARFKDFSRSTVTPLQ